MDLKTFVSFLGRIREANDEACKFWETTENVADIASNLNKIRNELRVKLASRWAELRKKIQQKYNK